MSQTFVLVHGAWHTGANPAGLADAILRAARD